MTTSIRFYIFLIFSFFLLINANKNQCFAQINNIGTPPTFNYPKDIYNAGTQNWDIAQDKKGILYFANNGGLLIFDGIHWRCQSVTNQTIIRSVKIGTDNKIYVGAQGELGYFYPNEKGALVYHSLKHLLPEKEQNFGDVWDIVVEGKQVFFRTKKEVFLLKKGKLSTVFNSSYLSLLATSEQGLFLHDIQKGLLKWNGTKFISLGLNPNEAKGEWSNIFDFGDSTLLVCTIKSGLFLLKNKTLSPFAMNDNGAIKNSSIYCATKVKKGVFAFGTSAKGVFLMNETGQVLKHFDNQNGLQKNNVISIFSDKSQNIWVGLDNGIDYIEASSPFTLISPDGGLRNTGYAVQIHDDRIYFGTSNGVYFNKWQDYYNPTIALPYQLVENTTGQVWNLSLQRGQLLVGHHEGTLAINKNTATNIKNKEGSWIFAPLKDQTEYLLEGSYNNISLYKWANGWQFLHDFSQNWKESARIMAQDEKGNLWVSHPYRGVFKIKLSDDLSKLETIKLYNAKDGFPSDLFIYVFKIKDEVVFAAERGIYQYNKQTDLFEPHEKWNKIFGTNTWVKRLVEAPNGDIWFVANDNVGVLRVMDGGVYKEVKQVVFPQLAKKLVGGFEFIYPYDEENVFFALESGFMHFNPKLPPVDTSFNVLIRSVELANEVGVLFEGNDFGQEMERIKLGHRHNALRFSFAATYFADIANTSFQFYLEGFEENWLDWTNKTEREYTNLSAGTYTFKVRAKNINGIISEAATFTFKILPPWYASNFAYTVYAILLSGLLFSLIFIPQKRFEKEKAALQSEQEKTLQEKEEEHLIVKQEQDKQIELLAKEKLEAEIQHKNEELATTTMHLVKKSETLQKIGSELGKISKSTKDTNTAKSLKKVIRFLNADEEMSDDWQQFEQYFDQVYGNFLKRLREKHPQLTPKDYRLCAYLRMNLSTKEIAPLMNISVRGVEIGRYRLRKKLELESGANLVEFILSV